MFNPFQIQNPNQMIMQTMQRQNPELFRKVQEMTNGKNNDELKEMANNIAKERGINLSQFANQLGIKI